MSDLAISKSSFDTLLFLVSKIVPFPIAQGVLGIARTSLTASRSSTMRSIVMPAIIEIISELDFLRLLSSEVMDE